jgi:hypothetical protein
MRMAWKTRWMLVAVVSLKGEDAFHLTRIIETFWDAMAEDVRTRRKHIKLHSVLRMVLLHRESGRLIYYLEHTP